MFRPIHKVSGLVMLLFSVMFFASCDSNRLYDENKLIPADQWFYKSTVPFDIQVTDTTRLYNVYVNLRISADYKYNNIFMWVNTTNPEKKTDQRRIEIRLADDGGKWLGKGLGDIFDYQFPVLQRVKFPTSGFYRFDLEQNMRDDTLANVKAVGMRVEFAD
jgi:gliding motility-associated lipoprotein GldH